MSAWRIVLLLAVVLAGSVGIGRATSAADQDGTKAPMPVPMLSHLQWLGPEKVLTYEPGRIYIFALATVAGAVDWYGPVPAANDLLADLVDQFGKKACVIEVLKQSPTTSGSTSPWTTTVDPDGEVYGRLAATFELPQVLIVGGTGRVAWSGGLSEAKCVVSRLVAGTFDAKKLADEAIACGKLLAKATTAAHEQDFTGMNDAIAECLRLIPENRTSFEFRRFQLTRRPESSTEHLRAAQAVIDEATLSEVEILQTVARELEDDLFHPNLPVALHAWKKAADLTRYKRPAPLEGAAKIQAKLGEWTEAIRLQALAVAATSDGGRAERAETLSLYQRHLVEPPPSPSSLIPGPSRSPR